MAVGDATVAALTSILKTKYDQKVFYQLFYRKAPFLGTIRKDEKFGANNARISLRYGSPQGGSAQFSVAQANKTSSADVGFVLTRAKDYQVAGISGEALAAAEGDENTIYNGLKGEMEGSMRNLNRSIQITAWRNGGGSRGVGNGSYAVSGTAITLATPADITNFEVQMKIDLAPNDGSVPTSVRAGGPLTITAVDRTAGIVTVSAAVNTLTGAANTDTIFRNGDYGILAKGQLGWLPPTGSALRPTSLGTDNWFGVDRFQDIVRLGGIPYSGGGGNKEETLMDAAELASREGADDLTCYINNLDRADIVKSLGSKAIYLPVESTDGKIGYRALIAEGPDGPIKILSEVNVPRGNFFINQMDTWVLKSIRGVPRILDDDGLKMLRESTNDGYEWRMGGYFQFGCEAPGYNLVGTW
jgi:hypothetical protein